MKQRDTRSPEIRQLGHQLHTAETAVGHYRLALLELRHQEQASDPEGIEPIRLAMDVAREDRNQLRRDLAAAKLAALGPVQQTWPVSVAEQ
jgi:hypothetical protein